MRNDRPDPRAVSGHRESSGIDALIDDAARRLVAGEPSSALRVGVRDRIGSRRPRWLLVPAWGVAVAVVIAAVVVGRLFVGDSDSPRRERAAVAAPATQQQAREVPRETSPSAATQPASRQARQFTGGLAAPPPAEEESPIPPITIEPLTTAPLTAAQITVDESSGVTPIEIEPLQIEPLLGQ